MSDPVIGRDRQGREMCFYGLVAPTSRRRRPWLGVIEGGGFSLYGDRRRVEYKAFKRKADAEVWVRRRLAELEDHRDIEEVDPAPLEGRSLDGECG